MVVAELDIVRITFLETKADAPSVVDGNRVLTGPIAFECVQPIARWHDEVGETHCHVDRFQLPQGSTRDVSRHALRLTGPEQLFRRTVSEGFDHAE